MTLMTGYGIGCHFSRYFTALNSTESYSTTRCSSYIIDDGRNHGTRRRYTTAHSSGLAFSRYQLSRSSWTRFGGCTWIINGIHDGANRTLYCPVTAAMLSTSRLSNCSRLLNRSRYAPTIGHVHFREGDKRQRASVT